MPNEITKQPGSPPSLQNSDILQPAPPDSRQDNETWKRLRQTVVDRLRQFPAFIEVIRSRSSDICRIKLPRETWAALEQGKAGWKYDSATGAFFPTVLGEKGEFLKQARLEPLAGDLANSLANLAIAQGIARIENELRDLRVEIQAIRQGQVDDRRGLLQAGIDRYEQALVSSDLDLRKKGLLTAIQSLTEARGQLLASAETHINPAYSSTDD